ncbi:amidohydrolase [Blastococcus sp. BMG 814]|uniref:Amidohydrolase n=1 Tax=Blastococcus carthaginiensis TaxID=3050034 RepID=A0ABT9I8W4_9ACTN|nr:amidohydrolase [Blastococcus carthaginiensis]MDP5182012.1 amidohydrolase [Blastococcus carthaginiensis]
MSTSDADRTTLYRGAAVITGAEVPAAEALVVRGDRLLHVGTEEDARAAAGTAAEVVDLDGGLVVPGFVDAHTHVLMTGDALTRAHLRDAHDLGEVQRRVREWADTHPEAPRVLGQGWLFSSVPGGRPTREMLDAVCPDRPVYLDANDYHSVWLNSRALAEVGITRDTPDPVGGRIARDPVTGEPTGHVDETAMQELVWPFLEGSRTDADRDRHLDAALSAYAAAGITGVVDMAVDEHGLATMARAQEAGRLPVRIVGHWFMERAGDTADHLAQVATAARLAEEHRSSWLRMTGVKFVVDGVIDGCTAAVKAPYSNGALPAPIWDLDTLAPAVAAADAAGLQIAIHAIGDEAIRIALDALELAVDRNGARLRRHRIEHLEYTDQADVPRLARLGITASMQPVHADPAVQDNWRAMLGDSRVDRGYPWPEFTETGARLAFGTDAPTAPHFPLPNLYIAATRRSALDPSLPPNVPRFALPLADALRHATYDAAWSCCAENERGMLTDGRLADFTVIDRDPFTDGVDALLEARVVRTVAGGIATHVGAS